MKEVIYTTIFIILGIVLIFLLVYMFGPSRHNKTDTGQPRYKAGVYTSSIQFEGQNLDVQVVVDENHINSVSFVNLNDTVTTMYPLMQSSMDNISEQICKTQSVDNISYSEENQYTASMLLHAVEDALQKAAVDTGDRYRTISVQMYTLYVFHPNLTFFCKRKNPTGKASRFRWGFCLYYNNLLPSDYFSERLLCGTVCTGQIAHIFVQSCHTEFCLCHRLFLLIIGISGKSDPAYDRCCNDYT